MRIYVLLVLALVASAAMSGAALIYRDRLEARTLVAAAQAASPKPVAAVEAALPAAGTSLPPIRVAEAKEGAPGLPELPTVAVTPHEIHSVPEAPPAATAALGSSIGSMPQPARRGPARAALAPASPRWISGAARVTGATTLSVGGERIRLFGVKPPGSYDHCELHPGGVRPCEQVGRTALIARLANRATVSCRSPAGQAGEPAFICRDAAGVDLGGFLVAEGYALADAGQSRDYVGAEGVARSLRRGLWNYR